MRGLRTSSVPGMWPLPMPLAMRASATPAAPATVGTVSGGRAEPTGRGEAGTGRPLGQDRHWDRTVTSYIVRMDGGLDPLARTALWTASMRAREHARPRFR
jgi:hypothetical protein